VPTPLAVQLGRRQVELEEELQALVADLRRLVEDAAVLVLLLLEPGVFMDEVEYAGHVPPVA
jgi:hypothetical protein